MTFPKIFCAALLCAGLLAGCQRAAPVRTPDTFPILTPPAPATPRINGAKVFGVRPGSPFLFQIAATGQRPMEFAAANLPVGLTIDPTTGLIAGTLRTPGRYIVTLRVSNALGSAQRALALVVGDEISLTPAMGWNSWNCWGGNISQQQVAAAAHVLVASGLRDHGWTYVNIDDGWQGIRGGKFNAVLPNEKFPDMPALAAEIHSLGLKLGIYSTPWRTSCYGQIGSSCDNASGAYDWITSGNHTRTYRYRYPTTIAPKTAGRRWFGLFASRHGPDDIGEINHRLRQFGKFSFARQDVQQWAAWGIDYLKYDWQPMDVAHATEMHQALQASGRDIVFSITNRTYPSWIPALAPIVNSWRNSNDIKDTWESVSHVGFTPQRWTDLAQPGHQHDNDMLVLGHVRWNAAGRVRLSSDEQYTHMSLWCLLASPLLLGCDLGQLDPFTLGLLTNDEVLAVDQDSLGRPAACVDHSGDRYVYVKPLDDGTWAVGLFNRGDAPAKVRVRWSALHRAGSLAVRDLWRQKDLGTFADHFETPVAPRGVVLVRVGPSTHD